MKIKRLHIINELGIGGTEQFLTNLLKGLPESEDEVIALAGSAHHSPTLKEHGIQVHHLNISHNFFDVFRLLRFVYQRQPDYIITWSYYADFSGCLAKLFCRSSRLIWNVRRSLSTTEQEPWYRSALRRVLAALSSIPDHIVFNSQTGFSTHKSIGYQEKQASVIPNGIDVQQFCPNERAREEIRQKYQISPDAILIGAVGRNVQVKGYDLLLNALSKLTIDSRLHIFLIGKNTELLRTRVSDLGIEHSVTLLPAQEDIQHYYNALDLLVQASHSEGFPNVIAEAMACGTPCVATRAGDAEVIIGNSGVTVPTGDAPLLAEAIMKMLNKPAREREEMGAMARKRIVEKYTLERSLKSFSSLFNKS